MNYTQSNSLFQTFQYKTTLEQYFSWSCFLVEYVFSSNDNDDYEVVMIRSKDRFNGTFNIKF